MNIRPIKALGHTVHLLAAQEKLPKNHPRQSEYSVQLALYGAVWKTLPKEERDRIQKQLLEETRGPAPVLSEAATAGLSKKQREAIAADLESQRPGRADYTKQTITAARAALEA